MMTEWIDTRKQRPLIDKPILFACDNGKIYCGRMHPNNWFYDFGHEVAAPIEYPGDLSGVTTIATWWANLPAHPGKRP